LGAFIYLTHTVTVVVMPANDDRRTIGMATWWLCLRSKLCCNCVIFEKTSNNINSNESHNIPEEIGFARGNCGKMSRERKSA
jgi:hypothetical protein